MFKQSAIASSILKKYVVAKAMDEAKSRRWVKKNFSPSVDFMCPRKTFFDFKYSGGSHLEIDERDFSYEGMRSLYVGNKFHEFIQKQFEDAGVLVMSETTLVDEAHHIRARLDMVIEVKSTLYLVELKSAKSYSIKMMNDANAPDMEHQKQIQLYFHLLDVCKNDSAIYTKLQGRDVQNGLILYENKNDHGLLEFVVNKDRVIINEILEFANYMWKQISANKEPKDKFDPDSFECKYKCRGQYYQMCHGRENPAKPKVQDGNGKVWGFGSAKKSEKLDDFI